ncbi:MAG: signal recognition particle protein [Clostridia bacterium]|nr:signal recognition particle protein [Clostridia bacterium]
MAAFSSLSDKLNHVFSKLKNRGALTELEIKNAMREIRIALLEADVNFTVVKQFVNSVSERAIGENIIKGLDPSQQVVKIVNEELVKLMGSQNAKIEISSKPPTVILMCGLQGAGKTTMCGKLAAYLKKQGKKPLLVAGDIYRPAAIKQLQIVGERAGVPVFEMGQINPVVIAKKGISQANANGNDIVIVDTAGRLQIDAPLMDELLNIKKEVNPTEILLVVDSMLGQESVNVASEFNSKLDLTGVILTKLDGDTRGGAALSIKAMLNKPIKFCGIGEKITDIEPFYPDRMASRILGMGDVLTLIEKAEQAISEEDAKKMAKKMKENSFDLNDYLEQIGSVKKMGNINDMLGMIPGMNKMKGANTEIDESIFEKNKAIIQSMTLKERTHPEILNSSRRKRIAKGSGVEVSDVNRLLNQFNQTKEMIKRMNSGKFKLPFRF